MEPLNFLSTAEMVNQSGLGIKRIETWFDNCHIPGTYLIRMGGRRLRAYTSNSLRWCQLVKRYLDQGFSRNMSIKQAYKDYYGKDYEMYFPNES